MATCFDHASVTRRAMHATAPSLAVLVALVVLSGCSKEADTAAPQPRPVRIVTVEKSEAGAPVSLTGRIEAEDKVNLAFRIAGRLLENNLRVGDRVEAGQVVARLEPQNEQNTLRSAEAGYAAAEAALTQARNHFDRQDTLAETRAGRRAPITTRRSRRSRPPRPSSTPRRRN